MTEATAKTACAAQHLTDGWECERCGLAWDDGDAIPTCEPMNFKRMRAVVLAQAEVIESSQRALVYAGDGTPGLRKFRHQGQLKIAMELRAVARLIDRATADREILDKLKGGKRS